MYEHKTVLLEEAVDSLNVKEGGIYVDCTTGGGGHSSLILKKLNGKGHLFCFDQDEYAIKTASAKLAAIANNFTMIKANFKDLKEELARLGVFKVDGVIYDLGVSSFQLDMIDRGFSYHSDAKLDMRMDREASLSAYDVVNTYSFNDLMRIFYTYGEEPFAKQIARAIEKRRMEKPIETTLDLVDVIRSALPSKILSKKGHPAKQVFQALRIAVNDELRVFEKSINDALDILNSNGYAVVITFHSLEDRICKTLFKEKSTINIPDGLPIIITDLAPFEVMSRKAIIPSDDEIKDNNRAHSAKMRVIRKR